MRPAARAATVAAGLALVATGCGVQATGVHVAQTFPFSGSGSSSSEEPSQSVTQYPMVLYFIPITNSLLPRQTIRYVSKPTTGINDLLEQLKSPNDGTLTTWVPRDLKLIPTSSAHQYIVSSQGRLNSAAEDQLACTFSYYWRQHPDKGALPSVSFILPDGSATQWNDCAYLLGSAPQARANAVVPSSG